MTIGSITYERACSSLMYGHMRAHVYNHSSSLKGDVSSYGIQ